MVKPSSYFKTIYRSVWSNLGRIISIISIILIAIVCYAGLGTLSSTVEASFNVFFVDSNLSDITIKATSESGFSTQDQITEDGQLIYSDVNYFKNSCSVEEVDAFTSLEFENYGENTRLYIFNPDDMQLNKLKVVEGRMPENINEVVVEQASLTIAPTELNSTIRINIMGMYPIDVTVVGIVQNPLMFTPDGDVDLVNQETLDKVVYCYQETIPSLILSMLPVTDLYVQLVKYNNRIDYFSNSYLNDVQEAIDEFEADGYTDFAYLTLEENKAYNILSSYMEKVDVIALVVPIFFLVVAALVVLTTMTRMIDEDRASIGCYSSLGVSNFKIKFKYMLICGVFTTLGCVLGMILGLTVLPAVIYPGFETIVFLPAKVMFVDVVPGIIASLIVIVSAMAITFYQISMELKTEPSNLLLPKTPKAGKKIFLEKIKVIWRRLPFRYKSSIRNIIRNKKHFWMTVITTAGATAIVFLGLSLYDVVSFNESPAVTFVADTIKPICILIIMLSLLLTIFVVYNLTNMNIGERTREIATLDVLGYHDHEVCMYIYREIAIMGGVGVVLGIPCGIIASYVLLGYLDFGSLADVQWYTYLASALLVVSFIVVVDLMLIRKILRVDMTTSLKSVD